MGTIVCQTCGTIIDYFDSNGVKTLYGVCAQDCHHQHNKEHVQEAKRTAV